MSSSTISSCRHQQTNLKASGYIATGAIAAILLIGLWYKSCGPKPVVHSENQDSLWSGKLKLAREAALREGADSVRNETVRTLQGKDQQIASLENWKKQAQIRLRNLRSTTPPADAPPDTFIRHLTDALILCDSVIRISDSLYAEQLIKYTVLYDQWVKDTTTIESYKRSEATWKEQEVRYEQEILDLQPDAIDKAKPWVMSAIAFGLGFYIATK